MHHECPNTGGARVCDDGDACDDKKQSYSKRGEDMKYLEIKITKAALFLTERELLSSLSPELLKKAIVRGKAIKRRRQYEARQQKREGVKG